MSSNAEAFLNQGEMKAGSSSAIIRRRIEALALAHIAGDISDEIFTKERERLHAR
jgi:hypothetical protein